MKDHITVQGQDGKFLEAFDISRSSCSAVRL